jgi:alpha-mannosidase
MGKHHVCLALGHFRAGAKRELNPAALADSLFCEPVVCKGNSYASPLLALESGNSLISTGVKPMTDGSMLLRLNETLEQHGKVKIKLAVGYKAAITNLRGEPIDQPDTQLVVDYKPYILTTVSIRR